MALHMLPPSPRSLFSVDASTQPDNGLFHMRRAVSGFSTADSKFLSIACRTRMVSAGDNEVYTGSGLRGVIPYVQCVAAMFLSQVCS
jgi:hypothetical protein